MAVDFHAWLDHDHINYMIKKATLEAMADAKHRRLKDMILFFFAISMIALIFIYCGYRLVGNPEDKWSIEIDTVIASGVMGYLFGKRALN